jgi:hypothetical protein
MSHNLTYLVAKKKRGKDFRWKAKNPTAETTVFLRFENSNLCKPN